MIVGQYCVSGFKIGNKNIGDTDDCYIIAEAGSNHEQNKTNALELIEIAASAEVDAVKFQLFHVDSLYSKYVSKETYEETKNVQMPLDWIPELIDKSKAQGITFLATPFNLEAIECIDKMNVPAVKWASGEINNIELLASAARLLKPMIIATGTSTLGDIELAIETVRNEKNSAIALLHCVSIYPTSSSDANLRMMDSIAEAFDYPVGFSDHTTGIAVSLAAVARGAKIIEKHFTLDKNLKISPDHPFSIHPNELKQLVRSVREISTSLGTKHKHLIENEKKFAAYGKRSLVANKTIPKGTKLTKDMISLKRPGTGVPPQHISFVIGRVTNRDLQEDEIISWDHLS